MEKVVKNVTPELRNAHLDQMASGAEVLAYKKAYQNAVDIIIVSIVTIASSIAYYQSKMRQMDLAYRAVLEAERLKWSTLQHKTKYNY